MINEIKIIDVCKLKKMSDITDEYLRFDLNIHNINKILLQLLYYTEHGIKKFVLNYDFNNINLPASKVIQKLNINKLYKLVKNYDVSVGFEGFPRCIYEKDVLRPGLRWYFEKNIFYLEAQFKPCNRQLKLKRCEKCINIFECNGVCEDYVDRFGDSEFNALVSNKDLYNLNIVEIEKFNCEELKSIARRILDDFKQDEYYMRKKFVFVTSFPKTYEDSSKERFVYYIYNREDDFEKTFHMLGEFFDLKILNDMKEYIKEASQIVISFGLMGDDKIRKTFYFTANDLNEKKFLSLTRKIPVSFERENLWGVGVDFKEESMSYKFYYDHEYVTTKDIKIFLEDINLENKRMALKFANSLIKPLNNVLFDYKYKDGKVYSKRIDISLQYNNFRFNQFTLLFSLNMANLADKELYTLSLEVSNDKMEKINFYYSVKLPDIHEEENLYRYYGKDNVEDEE